MAKKFNLENYRNELVPVTVADGEGDLIVTLNGCNYVIKRGQTVEAPRKVAEIIENSLAQSSAARDFVNSLMEG
jgi:hypothetical protein